MWPGSSPVAAAGGGNWPCCCESPGTLDAPLGLEGSGLPALTPALRELSSPAPLPALHLHPNPELLASLLGKGDHPQLLLWFCLLVAHDGPIPPLTFHPSWLSIGHQLLWHSHPKANLSPPFQNRPRIKLGQT
ncbi:unnamed protein product [Rangifer tarandus platyrhynchus]|uniref:Uncharacterized protein n=2 Tax=Rangifer tarandus platyrhynchus TaxID=3082113 RepID=A0ABN8YMT2_RANTA|nr:unnamed protein product [Rangifer tarandus platyrhynchus]